MARSIRPVRGVRTACVLAALVLGISRSASALEALGDINLNLRLIETVPGPGTGSAATGLARIEVSLDALYATHGLTLSVERPDGSTWTFKGRAVTASGLVWTAPGGEPLEPAADGPAVPSRGTITTTIEVPLGGIAMHEIVVRATGLTGDRVVSAEGMLRVPLGVGPAFTVDDGGVANFDVKAVR